MNWLWWKILNSEKMSLGVYENLCRFVLQMTPFSPWSREFHSRIHNQMSSSLKMMRIWRILLYKMGSWIKREFSNRLTREWNETEILSEKQLISWEPKIKPTNSSDCNLSSHQQHSRLLFVLFASRDVLCSQRVPSQFTRHPFDSIKHLPALNLTQLVVQLIFHAAFSQYWTVEC